MYTNAQNQDSLTFGHGPHACPGRFFAIYEIKCLVVEILRNYDIRLAGDVEGKGGQDKRPPNIKTKMGLMPNPRAVIEMRRRDL